MNPLLAKLKEIGLVQVCDRLFSLSESPPGKPGHELSRHTPIWSYCHPRFERPYQRGYRDQPLFAILPPTATVAEVAAQTRFICLFGATASTTLETLKALPVVKYVFEPDVDAFLAFVSTQDIGSLIDNQFFFLVGDGREHGWTLEAILPPALTQFGFPASYIQQGREQYHDYFQEMIKRIEFAYYRKRIYPAMGQGGVRGLPFRQLTKGIFYDQEFHRLKNIIHTVKSGNPKYLENIYQGRAILLGAGPGLKRRSDLIKGNGLTMAVNSAYGFCMEQNIFPDITMISDTSIDAAQTLLGHSGKNPNMLFGHWASGLGDDHFTHRYVGWEAPPVFGERPALSGYGSVASALFSLAEYMGTEECVLSGIHLATDDPNGFNYASGLTGKYVPKKKRQSEEGYAYPDLYPVKGADGSQLYTTLNFMDTAMVLRERMQHSGIRIINTDVDSLLHGPGITTDPEYVPSGETEPKPDAIRTVKRDPINLTELQEMVGTWRTFYEEILDSSRRILAETKPGTQTLGMAEERIADYDENSFSYIMQRFDSFSNPVFHKLFFTETDPALRLRGALYYFEHAHQLARECIESIDEQAAQLRQLRAEHGDVY